MSEQNKYSYRYNELSESSKQKVEKIICDLKELSVAEAKQIIMAVRSEIEARGSLSHLPDYQCH